MQAKSNRIFLAALSLIVLIAVSPGGYAQGANPGSGDAAFTVGFNNLNGVDNSKHVNFGGSVGANKGRTALAGEFNYQPMGSLAASGVTAKEDIQQYGVAARFSLTKAARVTPYALVAGGYSRMAATASAEGLSISAIQSGAYAGFGGGANVFLTPHWGIRPEFRWERQTFAATAVAGVPVAGGGLNDVRGTCGIFFRWGGKPASRK